MKTMKKICLLVLAVLMVISTATVAFAADVEITITGAHEGVTYTAYKMFDLTITRGDDDTTTTDDTFTYTVNEDWEDFFAEGGDGADYVTIDDDGYVYWADGVQDDEETVQAFAALAKDFAENNSITAAADAEGAGGTATIEVSDDGYYLVTSDVYEDAVAMIPAYDGADLTINEKNPLPTIDKEVDEDDALAAIGSVVTFTITVTADYEAYSYVVTDEMTNGLDFVEVLSVTKEGETATANDDYTVTKTDNQHFSVAFDQDFLDTIEEAGEEIVITYTAKVNANAIDKTEVNSATLTYKDKFDTEHTTGPVEDEVDTSKFQFKKVDGATGDSLTGATFELYNGTTKLSLVDLGDGVYRLALSTDTTTTTTIQAGSPIIKGLDGDVTTYELKEIGAPEGYNLLTSNVEVATTDLSTGDTDDADLEAIAIEIENNKGTVLPSTGGTGTVLLIAAGVVLFMGAAIVLVSKKRLYNEG